MATWRGARAWIALLLAAATIAAYSAAFRAPFQFDDIPAIRLNTSIERLLPLSVPLNPPPNTAVSGRPVVNLTLALNYAINEKLGVDQRADPDGPHKTVSFHIVNVLIHLFSALLLFGVVRRSAIRWASEDDPRFAERIALFAAALWTLHPIHTEAINYVIQRTELIVSACYLATLYASIRAWDSAESRARLGWYVAGVVACAIGMWSKEVMVTAPLIVLLYDWAFRGKQTRARLVFYAALFATTLIAIGPIMSDARGRTVGFGLGMTSYQYLYSQAWAVARYLRLLLIPIGLTFDYGERPIDGLGGIPGLVVLSACAIATVVAWTRPRWRWIAFIGTWFFVILAPSSSVVPITTEIAAERRVYLASAAVVVLVALGIDRACRRLRAGVNIERGVVLALALVFAAATFARSSTYADSERLWRDNVAKTPDNPRAYVGVGRALLVKGPTRYVEAEKYFERAIAVDSGYMVAWQSLGRLALEQKRFAYAAQLYDHVLRLEPNNLDASEGMVHAMLGLGNTNAAIPYLERLGTADPSGSSLVTLADAYVAAGRRHDAIGALQSAIKLNPSLTNAIWSLGGLLVEEGNGVMATPYLEVASRRDRAALGLALLSVAYAQTGRADDASRTAAAATAAAGDSARVFALAGRAMVIAQRPDEAKQYLRRALALDPSLVNSREMLNVLERERPDT